MERAFNVKYLVVLILTLFAAGRLPAQTAGPTQLSLTIGKSMVLDIPAGVQRVAVASGDVLEAVAVSLDEVMLNAKASGATSLTIWPRTGTRLQYDVTVTPSPVVIEKLRSQIKREAGEGVDLEVENDVFFLRGDVKNLQQAERALAIASSIGKTVNLLRIAAPPPAPEILLKIRFADVDRAASTQLGANFFSTGAGNTIGSVGTGQFSSPTPGPVGGKSATFNISDALNLFLFRPDLNLGATIQALQAKNLIQILAEPNLLTIAGKEASFLAGGEFPYPVVQAGGSGLNTVTIQFREFGIRITFTPTIMPDGSIHLKVAPEVSSLDYANGLTYQGFTVPGLSVRKVATEIELRNGQSFAIAGLLDNRVTDNLSKVPGLGNIPLFGRLFQSRSLTRTKTELLVVVTPELVRPLPAGTAAPALDMPKPFIQEGGAATPGGSQPDSNPLEPRPWMSVEQLLAKQAIEQQVEQTRANQPVAPLGIKK
jgi:pilus assembly protein CpaC